MEKKYWFRAKKYGIGWIPCSWQGWLVTAAYVGVVLMYAITLESRVGEPENGEEVFWFVLNLLGPILLAAVAFIVIMVKTGEPLQWRWNGGGKVTMHLHESPFRRVQSEAKKIECRLNDTKRRKLKVGQTIEFRLRDGDETVKKEIKALHVFASFDEMFEAFPGERGDGNMRQYYSEENEKKFGVVAIEFT